MLQLAWPVLLLLAGSEAAARKSRSRVRHFAMPFEFTVVNAANADHAPRCVCVAPHGCVLCTWLCGIHCVPRRGGTALLGMQHGTSAHGSGSSNGCSGVGAAGNGLWSSIRFWLCALSLPAPRSASRTRSRPPPSVSQRVHVCVAYIIRLHAGLGCCACTSLPCSASPSALKWEPCVQKQSRRARGSAVYSELKIKQNCALGPQNPYFFRCAPNHGGHAAGARRQSDISHMAHLSATLIGILGRRRLPTRQSP